MPSIAAACSGSPVVSAQERDDVRAAFCERLHSLVGFMAPERAMSGSDVGARCDLYTLGCVFWSAIGRGGRTQSCGL